MKRTWTIIGVRDVPRSFKWYQSLFGQRPRSPGHSDFGQLVDSDGTKFGPGDFVSYDAGTHHNSWTETGCLIAVFEWQRSG